MDREDKRAAVLLHFRSWMNGPAEYWTRLVNFAALWALILIVGFAFYFVSTGLGESFIGYYAPTRVFLSGGNPYEYDLIVSMILNVVGHGGNSPFYYPLWLTFPLVPLAILSFDDSRLVWLTFNVFSWVIAMILLERMQPRYSVVWKRWLGWILAFVLFTWFTLRAEQIACALFLDWVICYWAIHRRKTLVAAVTLSLLLLKPNITFLPFGFLLIQAWVIDEKIVSAMLLSLIILVGISTCATPGWWDPILSGRLPNGWNQGLSGYPVDGRRLNTTTSDFLEYNWAIEGFPSLALETGLGFIALYLLYRWRKITLFACAWATVFGFMLTPYAMQYDYAFLTPAFMWIYHRLYELGGLRRMVVIFGLVSLVGVLFLEGPISDGLWMPIILLILLFVTQPSDLEHASRVRMRVVDSHE